MINDDIICKINISFIILNSKILNHMANSCQTNQLIRKFYSTGGDEYHKTIKSQK